MTYSQRKAWLSRYNDLSIEIDNKIEQIEIIKAICEKCTTYISDMPKGGASTKEDNIIRLMEVRQELNNTVADYLEWRSAIESAIKTVDDPRLRTLLEYRYILGYTFQAIAEKLDCSVQWVYKLHDDCINLLD